MSCILKSRVVISAIFGSCVAELNSWREYSKYDDLLPAGVKIFSTTTTEWPDLGAWLIIADTTKFNVSSGWDFRTYLSTDSDGLSTVRELASDFGALIATNGGFFGTSNGQGVSYSLAEADGDIWSTNLEQLTRSGVPYYPTRCAFGVDNTGQFEAHWVYTASCEATNTKSLSSCGIWAYDMPSPNTQANPPQPVPNATFPTIASTWDIYSAVGGSPMLVYNSRDVSLASFEAEVTWGAGIPSTVAAPRTAVGLGTPSSLSATYTTPHLLWIVVDGYDDSTGISLPDLSQEFMKLGANRACNLDGGGSTQLVVNGTLINRPDGGTYERPLTTGVMLL